VPQAAWLWPRESLAAPELDLAGTTRTAECSRAFDFARLRDVGMPPTPISQLPSKGSPEALDGYTPIRLTRSAIPPNISQRGNLSLPWLTQELGISKPL
jgi:hypothetical protein